MTQSNTSRQPQDWQTEEPPKLSALWQGAGERRRWWRYWVRDVIDGGTDVLLHYGMRLLPIDLCSAIGGLLGRTTGRRARPAIDRRIQANLRHFHPEWSDAQVAAATTRHWDHLGRTMAEFSVLDRLMPAGRIEVIGGEHVTASLHEGSAIGLFVHTGNWEVIGSVMLQYVSTMYDVYEPPRNRFKHFIARRSRERYGLTLLPPGPAAARPLVRALREGNVICIAGDEKVDGGVPAPFFGRTPHCDSNLAYVVRLAQRTNSRIQLGYCLRTTGCRFRVEFGPPIELDTSGTGDDVLQANVNRLNAAIEPVIRANLDQWYWLGGFKPEDARRPPA